MLKLDHANFAKNNLSVKTTNQKLMKSDSVYGIYNTDSIKKQYKKVFAKFDKYINEIGIFTLPIKKYFKSQDNICKYIKNEDKKKWKDIFQKLIFRKKGSVLLRGAYYYTWLPSYIFINNCTAYEKWEIQFTYSLEALNLIHKYNLLSLWPYFCIEEQLLILCIIDHYKSSVFSALNSIYRTSFDNHKILSNSIRAHLDAIAQKCTDLYYGLIFNKQNNADIAHLLEMNKLIKITNIMKKYQLEQQGMRELDDPHIITLSILSLLEQIAVKKKQYDAIIDFSYGGIELGPSFISIAKLLYKKRKLPEIIHCFYSSKKIQRDATIATKKETTRWLFNFIPKHYHNKLEKLSRQKGSILLYDNNVTTFKTLSEVKHFFRDVFNITADGTVAAVYYSNISKYLLGKKSELLILDWQKILNYKPITDYITAFNTWNTSKKGKIIEKTFFDQKSPIFFNFRDHHSSSRSSIFKVCRIHNIVDLQSALSAEANMIGIHAVYPDRQKYERSQKRYNPLKGNYNKYPANLPIATYEIESIAAMQKYIPKNVNQALIFEKRIDIPAIEQTIKTYCLRKAGLYIQLHHRITEKYISSIKKNITDHIIATIGLSQNDFLEYFLILNQILNPKTDYILIDLSKHQPDIISKKQTYEEKYKIKVLEKIAPLIHNNTIPIILADDTKTFLMKEYLTILKKNHVNIVGIDIQNIVETPPYEHRYRMIQDKDYQYQIRIRKSFDDLQIWKKFVVGLSYSASAGVKTEGKLPEFYRNKK